jgi:hypothetical protein
MIVQLQKFKGLVLSFILFVLVAASVVFASAQQPVTPATPKIVKSMPTPTPKPYIYNKDKEKSKTKKRISNESDTPAEKSISVDAKVNISFCVSEGNVKVNGWDRNEIRAYVSNGSQVGFKILQKSKLTASPTWVKILGFEPSKNTDAEADECLSGDEIEIDVPRDAVVSIESAESETRIESVRKVNIKNLGGEISLSGIAQGINAVNYQGGITVGKSSGAMSLETTDGNIVAYEVDPSEVGDVFKARTNKGMIMLDQIEHGQMDIGSSSGSIKFAGEFSNSGQYSFGTQSGSILLMLPLKSSLYIHAILAYGTFNSEIPLITENLTESSGIKTMIAVIGKGEAKLNLKTYNGRIIIKKQ